MSPVRVIQMVTLKLRAPVGQDFFEPAVSQIGCYQFLWYVGQANAINRGIEYVHDAVENKLSICLDGKSLAITFKFPCVDRP